MATKIPIDREPTEHLSETSALLLDLYLPTYDVSRSVHTIINASPATTYAALKNMDFGRLGGAITRALARIRVRAIQRARRAKGLDPIISPRTMKLENIEAFGRIRLGEKEGEEIVVGAIFHPWKAESLFGNYSAESFRSFDAPGCIKAAGSFLVRPHGKDRTLLSYEARALASDEPARKRLFRATGLMGGAVALLMRNVLDDIRAEIEAKPARAA